MMSDSGDKGSSETDYLSRNAREVNSNFTLAKVELE